MAIRFPSLDSDSFELLNVEEKHQEHPESFWIPPLEDRQGLQIGQAVKLVFRLRRVRETGQVVVQGERLWVIVSEVHDDHFMGVLTNEPMLPGPSENFYLCLGAQVPFRAEHVVDVDTPPDEDVALEFVKVPARLWR